MNPNTTTISKFDKMKEFAPVVLRLGIAIVFFYFAISQLSSPEKWTSVLPSFTSSLPISAVKFVMLNGLFEIIAASLLVLGVYTRWVAILLAIHLLGITFTLGLNPIGVRDFGLTIASLTMFLLGAGKYSFDN